MVQCKAQANMHYRCKKSWGRFQKVMKPVRRALIWHGFSIQLINNKSYSFKYEYIITAPKQRPRKIPKIIFDPTSHKFIETALDYAKIHVNEMKSPFWIYNMNLEDAK